MSTSTGEQRALGLMLPAAVAALAVAAIVLIVGFGLTGLASVGSETWIEASYGSGTSLPNTPHVRVGAASSIADMPSKLLVGDEEQWLAEPRIPTQKTSAANSGVFALGDRVIFSVTSKGEARGATRTFEVVGIEVLADQLASAHSAQVLIAREIGASGKPSEKSTTLRLLVSDGETALPNKSL